MYKICFYILIKQWNQIALEYFIAMFSMAARMQNEKWPILN